MKKAVKGITTFVSIGLSLSAYADTIKATEVGVMQYNQDNVYLYKVQLTPDSKYILDTKELSSRNGLIYNIENQGYFTPSTGFTEISTDTFSHQPEPNPSTIYFSSTKELSTLNFKAFLANYNVVDSQKLPEDMIEQQSVSVENISSISDAQYQDYKHIQIKLQSQLPTRSNHSVSDESQVNTYANGVYGQPIYLVISRDDGHSITQGDIDFVKQHVVMTNGTANLISSRMNTLTNSERDIDSAAVYDANDVNHSSLSQTYGDTVILGSNFLSYILYLSENSDLSAIQANVYFSVTDGDAKGLHAISSNTLSLNKADDDSQLFFSSPDRTSPPVNSKTGDLTLKTTWNTNSIGTHANFKSSPEKLYPYFINGLYSIGDNKNISLSGEYFLQSDAAYGPLQSFYCDPSQVVNININGHTNPVFCQVPQFGFMSKFDSNGQIITNDGYSLIQKAAYVDKLKLYASTSSMYGTQLGQVLSDNNNWKQFEIPVTPESNYRFINYAIHNNSGIDYHFNNYRQLGHSDQDALSADQTTQGIYDAFEDDFYIARDATAPDVSLWLATSNFINDHFVKRYPTIDYQLSDDSTPSSFYLDGYLPNGLLNLSSTTPIFSATLPEKVAPVDDQGLSSRILLVMMPSLFPDNKLSTLLHFSKDIPKSQYIANSLDADGQKRTDIFKPESNAYMASSLGSMISFNGSSVYVPLDWS
ncbi:hypothetical protein [Cysteiniphilum halobium]|uniref:hypothetical protein n=1 Tax=Cysteiniphilum halobium TaxID=2219059 RepID=UPI000E647582|nr:hypothetical protein [Cysteiniphilum halobium]